MTPDAERRFVLVLASTAYVVALGAVWIWVAWEVAVVAAIVGPLLAVVLSVESQPDASELAGAEPEVVPEGLSIRQMVRRSEGRS